MGITVQVLPHAGRCEDLSDTAVVFPAYNEERRVSEAVETALGVGVGRVVCVNDCSTDGTPAILDSWRNDPRVDVIHHAVNQGKQAAVKHGLLRALEHKELLRFATLDADMQDNPAELPRMAAPVGKWDVVNALRSRDEMPAARQVANFLANFPYHALARVRIRDLQAGYRVYTREVAEYLARHLTVAGGYTLEHTTMVLFGELAARRRAPFRIAEVPVPYSYGGAKSHIRLKDNVQLTAASVLCAWRLARTLRG